MKSRLVEHIASILLITLVMLGALVFFSHRAESQVRRQRAKLGSMIEAPIEKINDPFERALFADCMELYYPGRHDENRVIVTEFFRIKEEQLEASAKSSYRTKRLSAETLANILSMYAKFLGTYLVVMALTYYGVQTLGSLRFILKQKKLQDRLYGRNQSHILFRAAAATAKIAVYVVLFCPAYVIAYSIRTEFNTDSAIFMVILGVISNGLLVMYMNKFYAFLVTESKRGYVENALVKNLCSDYSFGASAISIRSLLRPEKRFPGHVFDHIFRNARFQYLSTIKEQASFLITGLIITEMALNIHGHLTYELLRQLLYKNYTLVIVIMLCIFYTVKLTEIAADTLVYRETKRYENG